MIMKIKKLFCDFGRFSASCCLSICSPLRYQNPHRRFLYIARHAPSLGTAICSKATPKSQEVNL